MNLFNEYENKILQFITKYINSLQLYDSEELTEAEMTEILFGINSENYTSPELLNALFNRNAPGEHNSNNLMFFYKDDSNHIKRIMESINPFPLIPTVYENYWLKFILSDPKADLFLSPMYLEKLRYELSSAYSPLKQEHFDLNRPIKRYSDSYIRNFKTILNSIKNNNRLISVGTKQHDGTREYHYEKTFFPYKIKYSANDDSFTLMAWDIEDSKIAWINIDDSISIDEGPITIDDSGNSEFASGYISKINRQLTSLRSDEPIRLCINRGMKDALMNPTKSATMADDRFAYLFSDYDKTCYEDSDGNLIADINYYSFQYNEVLSNILSLGKYVKVLSPNTVVQDVVNILKQKLSTASR